MAGIPIHPMVVHFPLVFALLFPAVALAVLWALRGSPQKRRLWAIPVLLAGALAGSAFVALRTGEAEEETVEAVVRESVLHQHEEAAEQFLWFAGVLFLVALVGLGRGRVGRASRTLATIVSLGVAVAGIRVGAAGGELVYVEGAASAYTADASVNGTDEH